MRWLSVALRPTETVGLLGTGTEDGHLDFHTAPELSDIWRWGKREIIIIPIAALSPQNDSCINLIKTPLKADSLSPRSCPQTLSTPFERSGY